MGLNGQAVCGLETDNFSQGQTLYYGLVTENHRRATGFRRFMHTQDSREQRQIFWVCWTPASPVLHDAALNGNDASVGALIAASVDIDQHALAEGNIASAGLTPLHLVAQNGHQGVIQHLLAAGADIDQQRTGREAQGYTALRFACESTNKAVVKALIAAVTSTNQETKCGDEWTVLHIASMSAFSGVVDMLLAGDAEVNALGSPGCNRSASWTTDVCNALLALCEERTSHAHQILRALGTTVSRIVAKAGILMAVQHAFVSSTTTGRPEG